MQKHTDVAFALINGVLRPLAGATITVTTLGALATIYSDNGSTPIDNPLQAGVDGEYSFYASNGIYEVEIEKAGFVTETKADVVLFDPRDESIVQAVYFGIRPGIDNSASMAAAIAYASQEGGRMLVFPADDFPCGPQVISATGVKLVGAGSAYFSGSTGITQPTRFIYNGAPGGTLLSLSTISGPDNNKITDCALLGIALDGANIAARGAWLGTMNNCEISISAARCSAVQVEFGCVAEVAQATSSQHNRIHYVRVEAAGAANGIVFDTAQLGGNWSKNRMGILYAKHADGVGIRYGNSDNNYVDSTTAERTAGGTGRGVVLGAGNNTTTHACRANQWGNFNGGDGGTYAEGTGEGVEPSEDNIIWGLDKDNGASDPVLGAGAKLAWATSRAVMTGYGFVNIGIGASSTTARTAMEQAIAAAFPVVIASGNGHHVQLSNAGGGKWNINVPLANDNLEVVRAGAGGFIWLDPAALLDYPNDAAAAGGGVPQYCLYRNGSIPMIRMT